jgi:hypothetical protein
MDFTTWLSSSLLGFCLGGVVGVVSRLLGFKGESVWHTLKPILLHPRRTLGLLLGVAALLAMFGEDKMARQLETVLRVIVSLLVLLALSIVLGWSLAHVRIV